jgi:hypothetical protein
MGTHPSKNEDIGSDSYAGMPYSGCRSVTCSLYGFVCASIYIDDMHSIVDGLARLDLTEQIQMGPGWLS